MAAPLRIWCEACRAWHDDATPGALTATPLVPGCTGKMRHGSRDAALAIAAARHSRWRRVTPYRCTHCGGWHLSRTTPGQHVARLAAHAARQEETAA